MKSFRSTFSAHKKAAASSASGAVASSSFLDSWRTRIGVISSPVIVHRSFVPSSSSSSSSTATTTTTRPCSLKTGTCVAAVELDSPALLCGADSGEIPGIYRTAMLVTNEDSSMVAAPRPSDIVSLFAAPLNVEPSLFSSLFRALDASCGVSSPPLLLPTADSGAGEQLAYDVRCLCLACTMCSVFDQQQHLSTRYPLFWAVEMNRKLGELTLAKEMEESLQLAYRSLLSASSDDDSSDFSFALPSIARLSVAWRVVRRGCFPLRFGERVFPVAAPVLSTHLLQMGFCSATKKKTASWKGFQKKPREDDDVTRVRCNVELHQAVEFANKIFLQQEPDLCRVSSLSSSVSASQLAQAVGSERYFLSLTVAEEKNIAKGGALTFDLI